MRIWPKRKRPGGAVDVGLQQVLAEIAGDDGARDATKPAEGSLVKFGPDARGGMEREQMHGLAAVRSWWRWLWLVGLYSIKTDDRGGLTLQRPFGYGTNSASVTDKERLPCM